ncbi:transporter [Xanthomonas campestris pv. campestris]|nr:transporter [Xanthomonas campestris pv. campestris]MCF8793002.1 transporter [Xanthomonas campestris pv. campestris]MCF8872611.1 transporter [Xanthomonas campestris pv. campestris]MCF8874496.1 transporter [Xanthomonas campestris pv. campestris]WDJ45030.1 transporter [Xanthomonas campestris pv. campestris]
MRSTFSGRRALNPGAGYWPLVPNYAVTALPTPHWEISARLNYSDTLRSHRRPNLPEGVAFRNGQAGDAAWINFATSWEVVSEVCDCINAYSLTQLRDNRSNGRRVANSRQTAFHAGPGGAWRVDANNLLFANLYLQVEVKNAASGSNLNVQFVHVFQRR